LIEFSPIWWIFPAVLVLLILFYLYLSRSGGFESAHLKNMFVASGALLGLLAFALPVFDQPYFQNPVLNYAVGLPLAAIGLIGRVYPMVYLRRQGTTTTMNGTRKLVDTGPYGSIRHPQYTYGFIMIVGWFLELGALYSLCMLPIISGIINFQALIEEKFRLEKEFGNAYEEFKQPAGMFIKRFK
jgi:protein-S-isoprenylcysteine O-methyltransferase Ste14